MSKPSDLGNHKSNEKTKLSTGPLSHPARILVVEDDLCLETILTRLLQHIDPEVQIKWMTSADDAWKEIQTKSKAATLPYDLFIADISTPGVKNGIDFWKTCQMRYPDIPFLFTSGMPIDEFFKTFGNQTICPPFLSKPFAVGECREIMRILLENGKKKPNSEIYKVKTR